MSAIAFSGLKVGQWVQLTHSNLEKEISNPMVVLCIQKPIITFMDCNENCFSYYNGQLGHYKLPDGMVISKLSKSKVKDYEKFEAIIKTISHPFSRFTQSNITLTQSNATWIYIRANNKEIKLYKILYQVSNTLPCGFTHSGALSLKYTFSDHLCRESISQASQERTIKKPAEKEKT